MALTGTWMPGYNLGVLGWKMLLLGLLVGVVSMAVSVIAPPAAALAGICGLLCLSGIGVALVGRIRDGPL